MNTKNGALSCNADRLSSVTRIGNPRTLEWVGTAADCQSVIRQAASLRHPNNALETAV